MSHMTWVVVALSLMLFGCRATSVIVGVSEPSVSKIRVWGTSVPRRKKVSGNHYGMSGWPTD